MYAIVDIAGQQFKVEAGKEIFVQRLAAAKDEKVEFEKVLLVDNEGSVSVGTPYVDGAKVSATVLDDTVKADKVLVFKKIRRKGFQKLNLEPGQTGKAVITLDGEAFEYYDPSIDELSTRPGRYQILYGCSSLDKDLQSLDFVVN